MPKAPQRKIHEHRTYLWRAQPGPNDISEFKEHVRLTGCPETFYRITTSKAVSLDSSEILTGFQIDRKKRPERDEAPCPICSPAAPKFLSGYLVWFPNELVIRAIGKECGDRIDRGWNRRVQSFKLRQQQEQREEFIERELHQVPDLIRKIEAELARSCFHLAIWKEFKSKCPAIVQHLRGEMAKGFLTVTRKRNSNSGRSTTSSSGNSQFYEEKIGSVRGQAAVKAQFKHHKDLIETVSHLKAIDQGDDPEHVFLALCDMDTKTTKAVERVIKTARSKLSSATRIAEDFETFFTAETIETINLWATDQHSSLNFKLELTPSCQKLNVSSKEFGYECIHLRGLRSPH